MRKWDFEELVRDQIRNLKKFAESKDVELKINLKTGFSSDDAVYANWSAEDDEGQYEGGVVAFSGINDMSWEEASYRVNRELGRAVKAAIGKMTQPQQSLSFDDFDAVVDRPSALMRVLDHLGGRTAIILYAPGYFDE